MDGYLGVALSLKCSDPPPELALPAEAHNDRTPDFGDNWTTNSKHSFSQ